MTVYYSSTDGSQIVLNGSATINTNFLGVLGIDEINIAAPPTSVWGNTRLRVALVLDNTGSMSSSNKMTALKTASQNLLTSAQGRGHDSRRRLRFDHPVQQGCQRRIQRIHPVLAALGFMGGRERVLQQL